MCAAPERIRKHPAARVLRSFICLKCGCLLRRFETQGRERVNELESGIIPLLFKEGNVSALKQSVNSFTRPDALGQLITLASRAIQDRKSTRLNSSHV